jgi:hypothetical protein
MGFLDTSKVKAIDLLKQAYLYLNKMYGMSDSVFTPSSPTGQILSVVANISELVFLYLERAASELNIMRAQTIESVHGLSRLTGHDPYRGSSAYGMMKVKLNPSALLDFNGSYIKIQNNTAFVIKENGNQYFLNMDTDYIMLQQDSDPVNIEFVQGSRSTQTFVADGKKLQSYNVNVKGLTDHDRVRVFIDNVEWKKVDSLYDMGGDEPCFMCKSSVNMGLTVFFGNGNFGRIPESGTTITVEVVNHLGDAGNLSGTSLNIEFVDAGFDNDGETVDLNKFLSVMIETPPMMGAYAEPLELTRRLAPHQSKSFVLANQDNYVAYLSRYSQFNVIDAYNTKDDSYLDDDNVIYLQIAPNIKDKLSKQSDSIDYFNLPENEFLLNDFEKNAIIRALDDSGQQLVSSEVVINDIVLKRYALVVAVKYFENSEKTRIWTDIRSKLNTYFTNINRTDMIPKSDIVSLLEGIEGIDSVNAYFVSEENENAIRNGYYIETYDYINPDTHLHDKIERRIDLNPNEDPLIGLDNFGDIVLKKGEVAVIRGGWNDRDGNAYNTELDMNQLCGLTVVFTSATENTIFNKVQQEALNRLLKF